MNINKLIEENKVLRLKDEESTQLIIKLDTKIASLKETNLELINNINNLEEIIDSSQKNYDNKIKELSNILESIKESNEILQKENIKLKNEIRSIVDKNRETTYKPIFDVPNVGSGFFF